MLGKVYMQMGNYGSAETELASVINDGSVSLQSNFGDVFGSSNDLNSEIIYATQMSGSITDEYGFTEFTGWFIGNDSKAFEPLDSDLTAAFDAAGDVTRKNLTIDTGSMNCVKYIDENTEQDWIELRLADVILMYAEAMNENGSTAEDVLDELDAIRTRAGLAVLDHTVLNTKDLVRDAILAERRLELAFEGHRWFDYS